MARARRTGTSPVAPWSIALDLIGSSAIDGASAENKTVRIEVRAIADLISTEKIELGPAPESPVTELAAATKVAP